MTSKQALIWAQKKLKASKTASLDAEVLLAFVLKKSKEFLYTHPEKTLTSQQAQRLKFLINRRAKGEPVAYLTNHKEFYGLDFYVDKRVLIPRPETELLVEEVIKFVNKKKTTIADIGTGSGCIAITLKKYLPQATIYATDISKPALAVAKKNAKKHQVKIKFLPGDLLKPLVRKRNVDVSLAEIDIVVANLPYLPFSLKYEPQRALKAGRYGLKTYQEFFEQIKKGAVNPQIIFCEINNLYLSPLKNLLKKYFPSSQFKIKKDLAGLSRILIIKDIDIP